MQNKTKARWVKYHSGYNQRINSWFGKSNPEMFLKTSGKDSERGRMWEKSRNMNGRNSYICHYLCTGSLRTTDKKWVDGRKY